MQNAFAAGFTLLRKLELCTPSRRAHATTASSSPVQMYRLGAQGRALRQQMEQQLPLSLPQAVADTQRDVEILLTILRGSAHTTQELLSYLVHYLPRVKNEDNVRLLMDAFALNPRIWGSFEESYTVIEGLKALFDFKIQISEPTLPLSKFYHGVLTSVYAARIEHWKKSALLAGISLSRPMYESQSAPETRRYFEQCYLSVMKLNHDLIAEGFRNAATNSYDANSVLALSLACTLTGFTDSMKSQLPHDHILAHVIDLVFSSPYGLMIPLGNSSPVVTHLSRLSFVVENCFLQGVKFIPICDASLTRIMEFSAELPDRIQSDSPEVWDALKSIVFGVVIMFQGYASFTLNIYNGLREREYATLTTKVIKSLYLLNFILEKIGSGGFQAYNFVLFTAMDGLFQHDSKASEGLGSFMLDKLNLSKITQSHYESSKALFTLTYFENFTKTCRPEYFETVIEPLVQHLISLPQGPPQFHHVHRKLVEGAHSVALSTFSPRNAAIVAVKAQSYLRTVLRQFPALLSSRQLCLAVETITKSVAPPSEAYMLNRDNLREVLHTLYITIINCPCDLPLNETGGARSVRGALISALISTVPFIPVPYLSQWLDNIWELGSGDAYLEDKLWTVLSENVDTQRGTVGVQWWYNKANVLKL